jgi:hypothetical protein
MERIAMSQEEPDRLRRLKQVQNGEPTQRQAAECMNATDRWARKLPRRCDRAGYPPKIRCISLEPRIGAAMEIPWIPRRRGV